MTAFFEANLNVFRAYVIIFVLGLQRTPRKSSRPSWRECIEWAKMSKCVIDNVAQKVKSSSVIKKKWNKNQKRCTAQLEATKRPIFRGFLGRPMSYWNKRF